MWTQDLLDLWANTASFSVLGTSYICIFLKDNFILDVNGVSWPCSIYNVSVGPWLMTCHVFVWDWTRSQVSHCSRQCYHAIVTSTSFCLSVSNMTLRTCGKGLHSWHSTVWISLPLLISNILILRGFIPPSKPPSIILKCYIQWHKCLYISIIGVKETMLNDRLNIPFAFLKYMIDNDTTCLI